MEVPDIDTDIPFAEYPDSYETLRERIDAAFKTLGATHAVIEVDDAAADTARDILERYANAPEAPPPREVRDALEVPGVVVHLRALLSEYDKQVVSSAKQIRTYVTNRLIADSNHADPKIRLRCYELLGKISDVGLFSEKSEVTLRHRPTAELEQMLRERLLKTLDAEPTPTPQDAGGVEVVPLVISPDAPQAAEMPDPSPDPA